MNIGTLAETLLNGLLDTDADSGVLTARDKDGTPVLSLLIVVTPDEAAIAAMHALTDMWRDAE